MKTVFDVIGGKKKYSIAIYHIGIIVSVDKLP